MKKSINPRAIAIQERFFQALDILIESKQLPGLKTFCTDNNLNRTKYSRIRNTKNMPIEDMPYKMIDIDALAALCSDFGVSPEWLLLGTGDMLLKKDKPCTSRKK